MNIDAIDAAGTNSLDISSMRTVCLTAATCEILYALDAGDTIVGRGKYCDYPEEVFTIPAVNSGENTNIEQIISLSPDVVFMSLMAQSAEQVATLEDLGFTVIVTDAHTIEETYASIELIGSAIGKEKQAAEVVQKMQKTFQDISEQAEENIARGKTIYFEISPLEWGLWAAGKDTFMDELAEMMGVTNIFHEVSGWAKISQEQVLARNPDYIITITMYYGEGQHSEEEIASRAGWSDITAVQNRDIFYMSSDELSRPGPRLAEAAKDLYAFIYASQE
ncbi:MAG: ABC transporter substrate-binding protein [Methanomicrobiales archaeon]|nr:ABC transporter substrate-binding protein [Methanomicrobiales archaeon]